MAYKFVHIKFQPTVRFLSGWPSAGNAISPLAANLAWPGEGSAATSGGPVESTRTAPTSQAEPDYLEPVRLGGGPIVTTPKPHGLKVPRQLFTQTGESIGRWLSHVQEGEDNIYEEVSSFYVNNSLQLETGGVPAVAAPRATGHVAATRSLDINVMEQVRVRWREWESQRVTRAANSGERPAVTAPTASGPVVSLPLSASHCVVDMDISEQGVESAVAAPTASGPVTPHPCPVSPADEIEPEKEKENVNDSLSDWEEGGSTILTAASLGLGSSTLLGSRGSGGQPSAVRRHFASSSGPIAKPARPPVPASLPPSRLSRVCNNLYSLRSVGGGGGGGVGKGNVDIYTIQCIK